MSANESDGHQSRPAFSSSVGHWVYKSSMDLQRESENPPTSSSSQPKGLTYVEMPTQDYQRTMDTVLRQEQRILELERQIIARDRITGEMLVHQMPLGAGSLTPLQREVTAMETEAQWRAERQRRLIDEDPYASPWRLRPGETYTSPWTGSHFPEVPIRGLTPEIFSEIFEEPEPLFTGEELAQLTRGVAEQAGTTTSTEDGVKNWDFFTGPGGSETTPSTSNG